MAKTKKDKAETKASQAAPVAPEEGQPFWAAPAGQGEEQPFQAAPAGQGEGQTSQEAPVAPEERVRVDAPNKLNLRDGPHRDFHVLTELPDGAELVVLYLPGGAEVPGWALVRYGEGEEALVGWVNADYLDEWDENL